MAHRRRRRSKSIRFGKCSVSIKRDTNWDEFIVTTRSPAKHLNGKYHTGDYGDARATAAANIRLLRRAGVCR